jgi:hypothetical protein
VRPRGPRAGLPAEPREARTGVPEKIPGTEGAAASSPSISLDDVEANDGLCTLREAIGSADSHVPSGAAGGECPAGDAGMDTITFSVIRDDHAHHIPAPPGIGNN